MALHGFSRILGITFLLLAICIITTLINTNFVDPRNLYNLLRWTAFFGVLALGVAFVIMTGGIDLSIGSVVALTGITLMYLLQVTYYDSGQTAVVTAIDIEHRHIVFDKPPSAFHHLDKLAFVNPKGGEDVLLTIDAKATTQLNDPYTIVVTNDVARLMRRDEIDAARNVHRITLAGHGVEGKLLFQSYMNPALAVALTLLVGIGIGLLHGVLISYANLQPFIVTLCGLMCYRGLARMISGDQTLDLGSHHEGLRYLASGKPVEMPLPFVNWISQGDWGRLAVDAEGGLLENQPGKQMLNGAGQRVFDAVGEPVLNSMGMTAAPVPLDFIGWVSLPMPMLILLVIAIIGAVFLHKTVWGRYLLAMGRNSEAARFSGINTKKMTILAYIICSGLAGLGGVLFALDINTVQPASHGNFYELYAIAAAVLGGCSLRGGVGAISGVIIGTAVMRSLYNAINLLEKPPYWEYIIIGGVLLLGVMIDELGRRIIHAVRIKRRRSVENRERL